MRFSLSFDLNLDRYKKKFFHKALKTLTLFHAITTFKDHWKIWLLKTWWEKEKILVTSIFLLFPQYFLTFPYQISIFHSDFFCRLQMLSIWTTQSFCRLVKIYEKYVETHLRSLASLT